MNWFTLGAFSLQRRCFDFRASLTHPFPPPAANSHFNQPVFANTARPVAPHRSPAALMSLFLYTRTYYQLLTADFYFAEPTRHCHKSEWFSRIESVKCTMSDNYCPINTMKDYDHSAQVQSALFLVFIEILLIVYRSDLSCFVTREWHTFLEKSELTKKSSLDSVPISSTLAF